MGGIVCYNVVSLKNGIGGDDALGVWDAYSVLIEKETASNNEAALTNMLSLKKAGSLASQISSWIGLGGARTGRSQLYLDTISVLMTSCHYSFVKLRTSLNKASKMFEKIQKPSSIYQEVATKIVDAIVSGELKQGDKLPSERELAKIFGISQRTLREALRVVEEKGLIQTSKSGNVVKSLDTEIISQNLDLLVRFKKISWADMYLFRQDMDTIVTARCAENITEENLAEFKKIVSELTRLYEANELDWDKFQELDRKFHLLIAHLSGNPMHEWVYRTVIEYFGRYHDQFRSTAPHFIGKNIPTYEKLLKAFAAKDGQAAVEAAGEHMDLAIQNLGNRQLEAIQD